MDSSSTTPPAVPPVSDRPWVELAGHAAIDPAQEARVERWLAQMFGDVEEDDAAVH